MRGSIIAKWGSSKLQSGTKKNKVRQVLQRGVKKLQSGAGITKWSKNYNVEHNICFSASYQIQLPTIRTIAIIF